MARQLVAEAMQRIERDSAYSVLCWTYGLLDTPPRPVAEQAAWLLMTNGQVMHLRSQGERELGTLLAPVMAAG